MQDLVLIHAYKEGDNSAFWKIYEYYVDDIYRYIARKVWDIETSEDLTSKVWIKILGSIESYEEQSGASFKSWIYRIAHNSVIDYYRSKKENVDISEIPQPAISPDFGTMYDDTKKLQEVQGYLKTLSDKEQEVVFLRVWDDMTYKEISEVLGISVDNCKQVYSRTLKKIQANISLLLVILISMM